MNTELFQELDALMSDISERAFCAGWYVGLEFRLWELIQGTERRFGQTDVSDEEVARMKTLSAVLGGWPALGKARLFVPLDAWLAAFEKYREGGDPEGILADLDRVGRPMPYSD